MDDKDFERTVEELYAHGKDSPDAAGPGTQTHVLELQPRGASKGTDGSVSAQPAPRPSMEAPPRPSLDGAPGAGAERIPGEPRAERRDRTREWVHAHSASEPGIGASWKRSQDGGPREGVEGKVEEAVPMPVPVPSVHREGRGRTRRDEQALEEGEEERAGRSGTSPPRLDIPASLRPGRPSSWTPSQLQLEPQAAAGQAGAAP
ncbi:hypothetical protein VTO73DRAFT_12520 [Trametes versicolor]